MPYREHVPTYMQEMKKRSGLILMKELKETRKNHPRMHIKRLTLNSRKIPTIQEILEMCRSLMSPMLLINLKRVLQSLEVFTRRREKYGEAQMQCLMMSMRKKKRIGRSLESCASSRTRRARPVR